MQGLRDSRKIQEELKRNSRDLVGYCFEGFSLPGTHRAMIRRWSSCANLAISTVKL
jgi:hypothetical protein